MKNILKKIIAGSSILALSSLISSWLWVYRDRLLVWKFWASMELDAYFAAFRIPDLIYSLFIFATISVSFLPLYLKKEKKLWADWVNEFSSKVFNLIILITWGLSLIIWIFAPYFISFYTAWFSEEYQKLTVELMRILLVAPVFFAISSIAISIHNASHKFLTQWLAPIIYNLWIIFSLFIDDEITIKTVAYWVVFWAFLHWLIQFPSLFKNGFRWKANFSFDKEIFWMFKTAFPRMLSVSIYQISITIDTIIAGSLVAGSVTILNLAWNIAMLPLWIIVSSIAITTFTYLSKQTDDFEKFTKTLKNNLWKTIYWTFPALFWIYAISEPLIKFLFLSWEFTLNDVFLTKKVLLFLLISVWCQAFIPILNRAYFAIWNTRKPFLISLVSMFLNIVSSVYLAEIYWVIWIAIWSVFWMFCYWLLLLVYGSINFWKFIPYLDILVSFFSWFVMFVWIYFLSKNLQDYSDFIQLLILTPFWFAIYFWINWFNLKKNI